MKIVLIDGNKVNTMAKLHAEFIEALEFHEWYGANLDALYDELTESMGDIGVIAVNTELLEKNLGGGWKNFLQLMEDVKEERKEFYFLNDPFGE